MYLQFICEILKLKIRSSRNIPRNKMKQARLSSLLLLSMGAAFLTFARETSIVSINHAKANSSNLSGLEHSFWSCTRGHDRGGEVRFLREERRAPCLSFRVQMRACPHCTEKCVRQLAHICSKVRGCVKGLLTEK